MADANDLTAALAAAAGGLGGLWAAWRWAASWTPEPAALSPSPSADDLEEDLAQAMAQLADLQAQQHRLQGADHARQTDAIRRRAAALLQSLDTLPAPSPARRPRRLPRGQGGPLAALAARPQLRGALWGGGSVGVLLFLSQQLGRYMN